MNARSGNGPLWWFLLAALAGLAVATIGVFGRSLVRAVVRQDLSIVSGWGYLLGTVAVFALLYAYELKKGIS